MSRDWKPGDVAIAQSTAGESFLVVRTATLRDAYWSAPKGWPSGVGSDDCDYRPLVVIDPEDREQVERLRLVLKRNYGTADDFGVQAALREFANPTPPQCTSALLVKGEHFYCDSEAGHGLPHGNSAAEAIWGEQP